MSRLISWPWPGSAATPKTRWKTGPLSGMRPQTRESPQGEAPRVTSSAFRHLATIWKRACRCSASRAKILKWGGFRLLPLDPDMDRAESPLLTDLYQLTMMQAYLDHGKTGIAVFEF